VVRDDIPHARHIQKDTIMKKSITLLTTLFLLTACVTVPSVPQTQTMPAPVSTIEFQPTISSTPLATGTTLYISATMHIETKFDSWPQDVDAFLAFIQQTTNAGIHWSIGADIGWLEKGPRAQEVVQNTATMGVQWDIHTHNVEDYAKSASILSSWGVTPTGVINGS
jgi:hypothetical protein